MAHGIGYMLSDLSILPYCAMEISGTHLRACSYQVEAELSFHTFIGSSIIQSYDIPVVILHTTLQRLTTSGKGILLISCSESTLFYYSDPRYHYQMRGVTPVAPIGVYHVCFSVDRSFFIPLRFNRPTNLLPVLFPPYKCPLLAYALEVPCPVLAKRMASGTAVAYTATLRVYCMLLPCALATQRAVPT
eukprot:3075191-Rhodomonas_salina.2